MTTPGFKALFPGCFGQHVLSALYNDIWNVELNKHWFRVQGRIAGSDGLSEAEIQLAIDITDRLWGKIGITPEQIRADLIAGAAISDAEAVTHIHKISEIMGLVGSPVIPSAVITFGLSVASADGLEEVEKEKTRTIGLAAGLTPEQYAAVIESWEAEVKAYQLLYKAYAPPSK